MLLTAAMGWLLPLFHGEPKLAPIYNPVTHMVPPAFPLLLIFPAAAIDLVLKASRNQSPPLPKSVNFPSHKIWLRFPLPPSEGERAGVRGALVYWGPRWRNLA